MNKTLQEKYHIAWQSPIGGTYTHLLRRNPFFNHFHEHHTIEVTYRLSVDPMALDMAELIRFFVVCFGALCYLALEPFGTPGFGRR